MSHARWTPCLSLYYFVISWFTLNFATPTLFVSASNSYSNSSFNNFSTWKFSKSLLQQLKIEDEKRNFVRTVKNAIFSEVAPTPLLKNPRLVLLSRNALEKCLEISFSDVLNNQNFCDFACGNRVLNVSLSHRQVHLLVIKKQCIALSNYS